MSEQATLNSRQISYCQRCGGLMRYSVPPGDSFLRATCLQCGFICYENPKVVVTCALYEGDRILWIRRSQAPYKGCWTLPSGFMECGETLSEAACREMFEETGICIGPDQLSLYGVLSLPDINQLYISMIGRLPSHEYGPSEEAIDVRLLTRADVARLELGYPPATFDLLMSAYGAIEHGELQQTRGRVFEMRGRDAAADQSKN